MLDALIYAVVSLAIILFIPRLFADRTASADLSRQKSTTHELRSRVIISHSIYVAFSVMALVFVIFPVSLFVVFWTQKDQAFSFLLLTILPLILFFLGYLYFLQSLQRRTRLK